MYIFYKIMFKDVTLHIPSRSLPEELKWKFSRLLCTLKGLSIFLEKEIGFKNF